MSVSELWMAAAGCEAQVEVGAAPAWQRGGEVVVVVHEAVWSWRKRIVDENATEILLAMHGEDVQR